MNYLTAHFRDVFSLASLAESLVRAPNGRPAPTNLELDRQLCSSSTTIGKSIKVKGATADLDVRKNWLPFDGHGTRVQ